MKKRLVLILVSFTALFLLTACNPIVAQRIRSLDITSSKIDERIEQIRQAVASKDKEALKALFSKKALNEADNIDEEIDNLFAFLQGEIVSFEEDSWRSEEELENGKRTSLIGLTINIITDEEEYLFFISDYNVDTITPDNEGVYMLEACKASYSGIWGAWPNRMRAGIFIYS